MTVLAPGGPGLLTEVCHDTARHQGLAPALAALAATALPGLLPCGPGGHAVVAAQTYARAEAVWIGGARHPRDPGRETTLTRTALPGGVVILARVTRPEPTGTDRPAAAGGDRLTAPADGLARPAAFRLGLVWLRLGLSEALRAACVARLAHRRSGDSTLLQQQMVKGTVADVLVEHLEVHAVLTGADPGDLDAGMLDHLHGRITAADREQVRLLGASGYLTDSPGMTAYVSELLAEAHAGGGEEP